LRRLLERRGFHVLDVADGRAAIAAVGRSQPDLVLLDLSMPELDGVDVVRRLRAEGSHVPVVLCSGDLEYASDRGLEPGLVQSILQKPFSTEELIQAIERARGNGASARP
jgi:CheY-like chemotaxis protein